VELPFIPILAGGGGVLLLLILGSAVVCVRRSRARVGPKSMVFGTQLQGTVASRKELRRASERLSGREEEPTALPAGWAMAEDAAGVGYYWNTVTGETSWDRPLGLEESSGLAVASPRTQRMVTVAL